MSDTQVFEKFQKQQLKTVGDLITALELLPKNTNVNSLGADLGGYDVETAPYVCVNYDEKSNTVNLSHINYDIYRAVEKNLISYEEYKTLTQSDE